MLRIYRTNPGSPRNCSEGLIRSRVEARKSTYLIVPEQDTVMREIRMASILPSYAPLCFEVTNFTRFANTAFRALGGVSGEYCDPARRSLIMWRALTELAPTLSVMGNKNQVSAQLVENMLVAVKDLQGARIGAEDIFGVIDNDKIRADRRLRDKLSDLGMVYALYKKLLEEKYSDTGEDLEEVISRLEKNRDYLKEKEFFIEGFTSFTESQYTLIGLLASGCDVNVYLPYPKGAENLFEYTEIRDAIESVKAAARRYNTSIQVKFDLDFRGRATDILFEIASNLWNKSGTFDNDCLQNAEKIRIFEATTPYEMCDYVAQDIKRRVMDGESYKDFAIIARDANIYKGIIDESMKDSGVPIFFSSGRDPSALEAIKLIYTAYSIIRAGYQTEDVITYSKCGLSGISRDEADALELYVNTWSISGNRFTDGALWNMNPLGYTTRRPDGTDEKLLQINATRDKLIAPLMRFERSTKSAKTVRECATALYEFLCEIKLEEKLRDRAGKLLKLGEENFAEDNVDLFALIVKSLDTIVSVSGDMPSDGESFLGQFKLLISSSEMGRIPSYLDRVVIGSADMLRLRDKKHVYIIGVNAGEFPASPSDSAYFSERDKLTLLEAGLATHPEMEIKNARELFIFTRAMLYAEEDVTLLYYGMSTKFKSVEPSAPIDRIIALTGGNINPVKISDLSIRDRIYSAEAAIKEGELPDPTANSAVRNALCRSGMSEIVKVSQGSISNGNMKLGESVLRGLYYGPLPLTQTQLESYSSCPLSYFCRFTVKLEEEVIAEFDSRGIGTFIHAILENFFRTTNERDISAADLSDKERAEICEESARKYVVELGDSMNDPPALTAVKIGRLKRASLPIVNGLCDEFSQSKFKPRLFEIRISKGSSNNPNPIDMRTEKGRDVYIHGVIDRVDTYEKDGKTYVRVVDYKTGKKDFDPADIDEGRNLQMFLYLNSILRSDNPEFKKRLATDPESELVPAAVTYQRTAVGDVRIDMPNDLLATEAFEEEQKREGMVLDDEEIIAAMGLKYTPLFSKRSPNKIPDSKRNLLFTAESFATLMDKVETAVCNIADGIADGNISAIPRKESGSASHCDYCKFKPICRISFNK